MDQEHALLMEPNTIIQFKFVPNQSTTSTIYLKNITSSFIAFKIRTTAPKSYYFKPNQGLLSPNEQKEISVIMQPLASFPYSLKDKFLIMHCFTDLTSQAKSTDVARFWEGKVGASDVKSARLSVQVVMNEEKATSSEALPKEMENSVKIEGKLEKDGNNLEENGKNEGKGRASAGKTEQIAEGGKNVKVRTKNEEQKSPIGLNNSKYYLIAIAVVVFIVTVTIYR